MKKNVFTLLFLSGLMATTIFIACTHEPPTGNLCNLHLTYVATGDVQGGTPDGKIVAVGTGGTGFMYSSNGGTPQASGTFTGLTGGTVYKIVVTNAEGCSDSAKVMVPTLPNSTNPNPNPNPGAALAATATATKVSNNCTSDGTVSVTASGGTSPYQYSKDGTTFQSGATFSSLAVGAVTITVKDAAGHTTTATATVSAPGTMSFATDVQPVIYSTCGQASCHNHTNNYQTYSDIVGTSSGSTWSGNLLSFLKRVKGTTGTANSSCPLTTSSGNHDMPTGSSTAWTTFVKGPLTVWISQGYPNN